MKNLISLRSLPFLLYTLCGGLLGYFVQRPEIAPAAWLAFIATALVLVLLSFMGRITFSTFIVYLCEIAAFSLAVGGGRFLRHL